jgi:hypothetical protein
VRSTRNTCTGRRTFGPLALTFVTLIAFPALADGQPAQPTSPPTHSTPWDVTFMAGFLAGHSDLQATRGYRDEWFHTGQGGITLGRHLSPHFKVDIEFTGSGEGSRFVDRYVTVPGSSYPIPIGSEQQLSLRQVVTTATWQFLDNEWIHPFVQAGVAVDFDRVRTHTWRQEHYTGDPRLPGTRVVIAEEANEGPTTTTTARAVVGAGVKMYASPRIFVRTDARFGAGRRSQHLVFRVGVGVDF